MFISIVIPTVNREEATHKCIMGLAKLRIPQNTEVECLIIDNNSTDNTSNIVKSLLPQLPFPGKYCFQPKPGTSSARNTGIRQARGDIIAFTDDDCIVDENWLVQIKNAFSSDKHREIVGGRVELYNPNDLPETIKTSMKYEELTNLFQFRGFLHGCNLVVRRSVFDRIGLFDERLGPGTKLKSAEDADILFRAFKTGIRVSYIPSIMVYHNHGRSKLCQIKNLQLNYRIGLGAFYIKNIARGNFDVAKILLTQFRPPLRRWCRGPDRFEYVRKYIRSVFMSVYLVAGAFKYLKQYGLAGAREKEEIIP